MNAYRIGVLPCSADARRWRRRPRHPHLRLRPRARRPGGRPPAAQAAPGHCRCLSLVRTDVRPLAATATPSGFGPSDLQAAYNLPIARGAGQTIAIVDAYDDPTAEADSRLPVPVRLPPCTTATAASRRSTRPAPPGVPGADGRLGGRDYRSTRHGSAACPKCTSFGRRRFVIGGRPGGIGRHGRVARRGRCHKQLRLGRVHGHGDYSSTTSTAARDRRVVRRLRVHRGVLRRDAGAVVAVGAPACTAADNTPWLTEKAGRARYGCSRRGQPRTEDKHCSMRTIAVRVRGGRPRHRRRGL